MTPNQTLLIGIDAGGTTTDVVGAVSGEQHRMVLQGVNARRDGRERAVEVLRDAIAQMRGHFGVSDANRTDVFVAAGLAGYRSATALDGVAGALPGTCRVMSDLDLALYAAHGGMRGAVVIVGTGSNAAIRIEDGSVVSRGGLGYILGDDASGYALGRRAARLAAAELDLGATSPLGAAVLKRIGASDRDSLVDLVYVERFPIQQLAKVVIERAGQGDESARGIIVEELRALGSTLAGLDRARQDSVDAMPTCLLGGLSRHAFFRELLVSEALPRGWHVVTPQFADPAEAALVLAGVLRDAS